MSQHESRCAVTMPAHTMPFHRAAMGTLVSIALILLSSASAIAADLHPLSKPLPSGSICFELRELVDVGADLVVESTYQPAREGDVRKQVSLHLFDSPWRSGSRDALSVHRDDVHAVSQTVHVTNGSVSVTLPLHATAVGYEAYQLARVRIGDLVFERWFAEPPVLVPEFGLRCTSATLQGTVRLGGLGAAPLSGALPLWPTLRQVRLGVATVVQPKVTLWDPLAKSHWNGWRNSTPQPWPGGHTVVTRHIDSPTVWLAHEYFAYAPADAPLPKTPQPPAGVLIGSSLDLFWPQGEKLAFPDAHVQRLAAVIGLRLARLTQRARDLLTQSVELKPGVEQHSLSAAEWAEFEALGEGNDATPVEFAINQTSGGRDGLEATRRRLTEPWLFLFGISYDDDRRFSTTALVIHPHPWHGPLPE